MKRSADLSAVTLGCLLLVVAGCAAPTEAAPERDPDSPALQDAYPAEVPPNRCYITGTVIETGELEPDTARRGGYDSENFVSVRVQVATSAPDASYGIDFCVEGHTETMVANEADIGGLAGQTVRAEIELRGSTQGRHWHIHAIQQAHEDEKP